MTSTLIPGIYTSYELSGVRYTGKKAGTAGFVWKGTETETQVSRFTGANQIAAVYGTDSSVYKTSSVLFANGASCVKTVQVIDDYSNGFELLMKEEDVAVMLCDSEDSADFESMRDHILNGGENFKYRIGVCGAGGEVADMCDAAKTLNCERMVLLPDLNAAFALAGVILGTSDPSLPYNGAELSGVEADFTYTDEEVNLLLESGVTPLRTVGGICEVIRCVTTKTETDDMYDTTWRDVNTVLVTDYVILQIRSVLKSMFTRAKNTERTRGAVRTQVVISLERMAEMGIIESYGNVTAEKSGNDPSVCQVNFEFTPAGGMHSIVIAAGITV
ncbi:MAG: phage tail sheath protein [Oscillospiraceae bacterium]|nr:phage tail sheath protein [Oscillospiraceae bacterium]